MTGAAAVTEHTGLTTLRKSPPLAPVPSANSPTPCNVVAHFYFILHDPSAPGPLSRDPGTLREKSESGPLTRGPGSLNTMAARIQYWLGLANTIERRTPSPLGFY